MSFDDEIKKLETQVFTMIETKVKAATTVAAVSSLVVSLLGLYVLHGAVPDWLITGVGTVVTAGATLLAGWLAKHTPRPTDVLPPTS